MEDRYKTIGQVASRSHSNFCAYVDTVANEFVIVNKVPYEEVTHGVPSSVIRDVSILKELDHENIMGLQDVWADTKGVALVFEYLVCSLQTLMETQRWISLQTKKMFLYQILSGVSCCHSHQIIHRQMNLKNILVDRPKMVLKLACFGISGEVGTLQFLAPEMLFGCKEYSHPVDIWAVGCIFGYMVKGRKLFDGDSVPNMLNNIFSVLGTPDEQTWPGVTKLCPWLHMIKTYSPQDLAKQVPGLEAYGVDLLSRLLVLDPSQRITADEALKHPYFSDL